MKKKTKIRILLLALFIVLLGSILFIVFYYNQDTTNVGTTTNNDSEIAWKKNIKSYNVNELTNGYYIKSGEQFYPLTSLDKLYDNNNSIVNNIKEYNQKTSRFYGLYNLFLLNTSYKDNIPHIKMQNKDDKIVFVGDTILDMILLKNAVCLEVNPEEQLQQEIEDNFALSNFKIGNNLTSLQKGTKTSEVLLNFVILGTYTNDYTITKNGYMEINFEKNDCGTGMYLINDKAFFIEQDNNNAENIVLQDRQEQLDLADILLTIAQKKRELEDSSPMMYNNKTCNAYLTIKEGTSVYKVDTNNGLLSALRKGIKIIPEKTTLSKDYFMNLPEGGFGTWEDQISTKIINGTRYYFLNNVDNAYAIKAVDYYNILVQSITNGNFEMF